MSTIEELKRFIKNYGGELDTTRTIADGSHSNLFYKCSGKYGIVHDQERRYDKLLTSSDFCSLCNKSIKDSIKFKELEEKINPFGYTLLKFFREDSRIKMIIRCSNNHEYPNPVRSDRAPPSCKECIQNSDVLWCPGCCQNLTLDKFNNCESNTYRQKKDHYCIECRHSQRAKKE
jgi:hypothetical protein